MNGNTAKSVYSFTHFDIWGYGTNFFTSRCSSRTTTIRPSPCTGFRHSTVTVSGAAARAAPAPPSSTACSARPSAGTKSSAPRPSAWARCITFRSKSAPTSKTENNFLAPAKRDLRRRSAVRLRSSLQGLLQRRALGLQGNQPQRVRLSAALFRPGHSWRNLPRRRQHRLQARPGRLKSTTTWIWASCRRTCSTSRSAAVLASTDRRATRTPAASDRAFQHRYQDRNQQRTDPSDLRRLQGASGVRSTPTSSTSGLPIATGRTSSASTTKRDARRLYARVDGAQSTNSCTEQTVYAGVTVKF